MPDQQRRRDRVESYLTRRRALAGGAALLTAGGSLVVVGEPATAAVSVDSYSVSDAEFTTELHADHRIDIITAGWTDPGEDVHNGEAIAFRCAECGNADESVFEIRHDEDCSLAGRYSGNSSQQAAVTDGGH